MPSSKSGISEGPSGPGRIVLLLTGHESSPKPPNVGDWMDGCSFELSEWIYVVYGHSCIQIPSNTYIYIVINIYQYTLDLISATTMSVVRYEYIVPSVSYCTSGDIFTHTQLTTSDNHVFPVPGSCCTAQRKTLGFQLSVEWTRSRRRPAASDKYQPIITWCCYQTS